MKCGKCSEDYDESIIHGGICEVCLDDQAMIDQGFIMVDGLWQEKVN